MIIGRRWKAIVIAIGFSAALVHIDTLNNGFVLDDSIVIVTNDLVTGDLDLSAIISHTFWGDALEVGSWRPLPILTFSLNHAISGINPASYHLINTLLHGLTTILVIFLAIELGIPKEGAVVAGSLFAVHPMHVDCIAPVVGRADLFLGVFGLASYLFWERGKTVVSILFLVLALLSKEMAVVLMFVFVWRNWSSIERLSDIKTIGWRWIWPIVTVATWLLLRYLLFGRIGEPRETFRVENLVGAADFAHRFWTAGYLYVQLLKLVFLPTRLLAEYSYAIIPVIETPTFFSVGGWIALLVSISGIFIWGRRKPKLSSLLVLWTGGFLLVSNLVVYTPMIFAERVFYLPSAAFFILVGHLWGKCFAHDRQVKKWWKPMAVVALIIALLGLGLKSVLHVRNWRSTPTLVEHMVREAPTAVKWLNYAFYELYLSGRISREQAAVYIERSLNILSEYAPTHVAAALLAMEYDKPKVALAQLRHAGQLKPNSKEVMSAWCVFSAKFNPEEALEKCTKAVQLQPKNAINWGLLAVALDRNNEPEKAEETFQKAFEIMIIPDYKVYANYGVFLAKRGHPFQARAVFQYVVENNPNDQDARKFLDKLDAHFPVKKQK